MAPSYAVRIDATMSSPSTIQSAGQCACVCVCVKGKPRHPTGQAPSAACPAWPGVRLTPACTTACARPPPHPTPHPPPPTHTHTPPTHPTPPHPPPPPPPPHPPPHPPPTPPPTPYRRIGIPSSKGFPPRAFRRGAPAAWWQRASRAGWGSAPGGGWRVGEHRWGSSEPCTLPARLPACASPPCPRSPRPPSCSMRSPPSCSVRSPPSCSMHSPPSCMKEPHPTGGGTDQDQDVACVWVCAVSVDAGVREGEVAAGEGVPAAHKLVAAAWHAVAGSRGGKGDW